MRVVVAPDSFKGTLSSVEVSDIVKQALKDVDSSAVVTCLPMADGGEGTVTSVVAAAGGVLRRTTAHGCDGRIIHPEYGVLYGGNMAIVEIANICGLNMVQAKSRNPMDLSTHGVGEVIRKVLDDGIRHIGVGLGGSATNDGGLGMLQALGADILDAEGVPVPPGGQGLEQVAQVDLRGIDPRLAECHIQIVSDVDNPLCGPNGASYVYGGQKGASRVQIDLLDDWMQHYAVRLEEAIGREIAKNKGAGAAGGLGFALLAIGGKVTSGATWIGEMCGLQQKLMAADWVITGEGRTDTQTLFGKVPYHVAKVAQLCGTRSALLSGTVEDSSVATLRTYFDVMMSVTDAGVTLDESLQHPREALYEAAVLLHAKMANPG